MKVGIQMEENDSNQGLRQEEIDVWIKIGGDRCSDRCGDRDWEKEVYRDRDGGDIDVGIQIQQ